MRTSKMPDKLWERFGSATARHVVLTLRVTISVSEVCDRRGLTSLQPARLSTGP